MSDNPLVTAIQVLQKQFGMDVISTIVNQPVPVIPTGMPNIDAIVGQPGFPRGKIIEIYGPDSTGKSLLSATVAAAVQKAGGTVLWIDHEYSLDYDYLKAIGVQEGAHFFVAKPETMEKGFAIAIHMVRTGKIDLVVFDSVGAMLPMNTSSRMEKVGIGDQRPGEVSRALSICLLELLPELNKGVGTTAIFVNHIRSKIDSYGGGQTTAGGNALKYYGHVRIRLDRRQMIKDTTGPIGMEIRARIEKNKVGAPFRETTFTILFGKGIDRVYNVFDILVKMGVIEVGRTGWVEWKEVEMKIRGRDNFVEELRDNPDLLEKAFSLAGSAVTTSSAELETEEVDLNE